MTIEHNEKSEIKIFLALILTCFLSNILLYYEESFQIIYTLSFISILFFFVYISRANGLSLIFAFSILLYFYQVPFLDYYPKQDGVYFNYSITTKLKIEFFFIINNVFIAFFIILSILKRKTKNWFSLLESIYKDSLLNYIYFFSFILCFLLLSYAISQSGGITAYLILNKFEASENQKLSFFTYKDFFIIFLISGFLLKKSNSIFFLSTIVFGNTFELLSSKRFLILVTIVIIFIFKYKQLNIKTVIGVVFLLLFGVLSKLIYYSLKVYLLGNITFSEIFWFTPDYIFQEVFLIHEGRAHLELLINFLYNNIEISKFYFIEQLVVGLPFGHKIFPDYQTAGVMLQKFFREGWSGLASSQYVIPYLSWGIFGVYFVYFIQTIVIYILFKLLSFKNTFVRLYFISNVPIIFFYSHREEIIVIFKSLFINFIILLILFILSYIAAFFKQFIVYLLRQ